MHNNYEFIYKKPGYRRFEVSPEIEELAQTLLKSGRMRIDTEDKANFIRFSRPYEGINMVFSYRELYDDDLTYRTKKIIKSALGWVNRSQNLNELAESEFLRLREEIKRNLKVDEKTEIRLARLIVQAAHPAVIHLLIAEGAEVFITYAYAVGDMLDIQSWQQVGESSGLQSSSYNYHSVFVSLGGNPFISMKYSNNYGDGDRAISRMMVIAGQELGHFSDIIRNKRGRPISRFSANLQVTIPSEPVRTERVRDIEQAKNILELLDRLGMKKAAEQERHVKFYRKMKRYGLVRLLAIIKKNRLKVKFFSRCKWKRKLHFIFSLPLNSKYPATEVNTMAHDMLFNLEPKHEAYEREDPLEEEAVACVEALARVPQQVIKWGHKATSKMMPGLYKIYYEHVIPTCIKHYEEISGKKYHFRETKRWFISKLILRFSK